MDIKPGFVQGIILSLCLMRMLRNMLGSSMFNGPILDLIPIFALVILAMVYEPRLIKSYDVFDQYR